MRVGQQTTFDQIHTQFRPGPLSNSDQHLRLTGTSLHTHNPLMPHGKGAAALQARLDKYDNAATAVKDAIAHQYSPEIADRVFRNLGLGSEVRLGDLRTIKAEIERQTTVDLGKYDRDTSRMLQAAIDGTDPPLTEAFEAFGQKSMTSENLDFLRAVSDYRREPTAEKARAIVDEFVDGGRRVNPTDRDDDAEIMFRATRQALQRDGADPAAFDDIYDQVFNMTSLDVMAKFVRDQPQG